MHREKRACLQRDFLTVSTPYGPVRVKLAFTAPGTPPVRVTPEFKDCRARAMENRVPIQEVYRTAQETAAKKIKKPGPTG